MAQANCQIKQAWEVAGGTLEVKLTTDRALSAEEYEQFGSVVGAVEHYATEWPTALDDVLRQEAEEDAARRAEQREQTTSDERDLRAVS